LTPPLTSANGIPDNNERDECDHSAQHDVDASHLPSCSPAILTASATNATHTASPVMAKMVEKGR
jgi:hypothetical protein